MSSLWPSPEDLADLDEGVPPASEYLRWLRDVVNLFDRAMERNGISADRRDRIIQDAIHDGPTPRVERDWAEPDAVKPTPTPTPADLAIIDMLAEAAPACVKARPTWAMPAATNACGT